MKSSSSRLLLRLALLALAAACALCAPPAEARALRLLVRAARAAQVSDVDGTYSSVQGSAATCPAVTQIAGTTGVDRAVGFTPVQNIEENGAFCSGGTMYTVTETVARDPAALRSAKLDFIVTALEQNAAARQVVSQPRTTEMLVGVDDKARECRNFTYPQNTVYFFIKAGAPQEIRVGPANNPEVFNVPADQKALLVVSPRRLCISTANATFPSPSPMDTPEPTPLDADATESPDASPDITSEEDAEGDDDDGSVCFPSSASVTLVTPVGHKKVPIASLRVGDTVVSGPAGETSDVIMFTHRAPAARHRFVRLVTDAGPAITLTPGHYVPVHTASAASPAFVPAKTVRVGDELTLASGVAARVRAVQSVVDDGLFNPQTVSGTIVVDGVVASTYTTAVHPVVAHRALLAPVRWLYSTEIPVVRTVLDSLFENGSPTAASLLPSGPETVVF